MVSVNYVADAIVRKCIPVGVRYDATKSKFFRAHPKSDSAAYACAPRNVVSEIEKNGIHIWRGYMNHQQAIDLGNAALPFLRKVQAGALASKRTLNDKDAGLFRLRNADTEISDTKPIFDDVRLTAIAAAVTTPNVRAHMRMVELREGIYSHCSEDCWHFDEPFKYKFKFFLLLSDVTEDNSPFSYVKRSHLGGKWRRAKELDAFHYGYDGQWGFYHQHEYDALLKKHPEFEPIVCTGKAGDMILFDANGLHRREILRSGYRVILSNYYQA